MSSGATVEVTDTITRYMVVEDVATEVADVAEETDEVEDAEKIFLFNYAISLFPRKILSLHRILFRAFMTLCSSPIIPH